MLEYSNRKGGFRERKVFRRKRLLGKKKKKGLLEEEKVIGKNIIKEVVIVEK
ncbi:35781_t:CDS:2, partial [Gigaspora margarita]